MQVVDKDFEGAKKSTTEHGTSTQEEPKTKTPILSEKTKAARPSKKVKAGVKPTPSKEGKTQKPPVPKPKRKWTLKAQQPKAVKKKGTTKAPGGK